MQHRPLKQLCGLIATAAVALVLIGCNGKAGSNGLNGTNGAPGAPGTNGTNGTSATITVNAAQLTPDQWANLSLQGSITSVTMGGAPVVNFTITNNLGTPVIGLANKAANGKYPNFGFSIAKLVPGDATTKSPSRWVNYVVTETPAAGLTAVPGFAEHENGGTLKDNLDGSYTYTFALDITKVKGYVDAATVYDATHVKADLDDLTYVPTLTHRLIITAGGKQPGTTAQALNSANLSYDFIPSTGKVVAATDPQRVIADQAACNSCHTKLAMHANFFPPISDVRLCVVCHTDQHKYGAAESLPATGNVLVPGIYGFATQKLQGMGLANFPNMVHKIHRGEGLYYQGYNQFGVLYNETTYPQDQRNCTKCHSASAAAPQGDNWMNVPSRLACGACHDSIIWAAGTNHKGGPQTSDVNCSSCHGAATMQIIHTPLIAPNVAGWTPSSHTNGSYIADYKSILPVGAHQITYDLKSVTLNSSAQPVFLFRFVKDGTPVVFNTYSATGKTELMDGYVGSPNVYLAFGVPQDGILTPADWNATASSYLKKIWNGAASGTGAGTMAGPDANGYYTVTLTGVKIPTTATQVTGGIGYNYGYTSLPLTQTDLPSYPYDPVTFLGGLSVPAPNVAKLVSGALPTGFAAQTARRAIVTTAKCNDCHAYLGVFTDKVYHAGERNDATTCTFCHNVNRVNSGWGVNIKDAVHALHAGGKRANKFSWEASAGDKYWNVTYPAILNNCEACHVPGSYDFSNSANAAALPNLLWTTVATGTTPATINVITTGKETIPGTYYSPFVTANTVYGAGFTTNFATASTTPYVDAVGTTLVNSPITSACSSCHDSAVAIAHMKGNGGAFYEARTTALAKVEQCLVCHGSGRTADIKGHMNF